MKRTTLFLAFLFAFAANAFSQGQCLSSDDTKKIIESIKSDAKVSENKKLAKELVEMRTERAKLDSKIASDVEKNRALIPQTNDLSEKHLMRVCQILKENGWLRRELVTDDGFQAFLFLITNNKNIPAQQELLPVLIEAAKKDYVGNPLIASFVDSIRVGSRMPQIFGTQAAIRNNVVYLYPLQNEEKVDEWRKEYDMSPLSAQIRGFEAQYLMPVLKSQRQNVPPNLQKKSDEKNATDTQTLGLSDDENEPLKVDTRLVNINARILTQDMKTPVGLNLTKDDFTITENGEQQEIAFFSSTEQPFDLVLLLDFSGSTVEKRDLIKKSAQRFVDVARPNDRIAVVVFATDTKVVSELTSDKAALKKKINDIDENGGSPVWDSLKFVYDNVLKEKNTARRSAIVLMTDGDDNSLRNTFADAIEFVRRNDATVFPVYIGRQRGSDQYSERFVRKLQQSLSMIAEESGGQLYNASNLKDLSGVYEQVINEVGQLYSIGYEPKNETRDGTWRAISVKIKTQPNLVVRTRRGYYAN